MTYGMPDVLMAGYFLYVIGIFVSVIWYFSPCQDGVGVWLPVSVVRRRQKFALPFSFLLLFDKTSEAV